MTESRIVNEEETRRREIERTRVVEEAEIAAREATEKLRIDADESINAERIAWEERTRSLEIARTRAVEEAEIAAQQAVEAAKIAREHCSPPNAFRCGTGDPPLEIERNEMLDKAEVASRHRRVRAHRLGGGNPLARDRARPKRRNRGDQGAGGHRGRQDRPGEAVAAERILADRDTRGLEIERSEALDAAELKRRDAIERQRIGVELALEADRIASAGPARS